MVKEKEKNSIILSVNLLVLRGKGLVLFEVCLQGKYKVWQRIIPSRIKLRLFRMIYLKIKFINHFASINWLNDI